VGWREKLNQHSGLATIAAITGLIAALLVMRYFLRTPKAELAQAYFTNDDAESYFTAAYNRFPPFEHNGREAVRAYLFTCNGGESRFVGYMQKYTPEAKRALEQAETDQDDDRTFTDVLEELPPDQILVKKPGEARWIPRGTPQAKRVREVQCPDGSRARVVLER